MTSLPAVETISDPLVDWADVSIDRWYPDPLGADVAHRKERSHDILRLLVRVGGGSKEPLLAEWRVMLADRLLGRVGYDTDREVRILELLKVGKYFILEMISLPTLDGDGTADIVAWRTLGCTVNHINQKKPKTLRNP